MLITLTSAVAIIPLSSEVLWGELRVDDCSDIEPKFI